MTLALPQAQNFLATLLGKPKPPPFAVPPTAPTPFGGAQTNTSQIKPSILNAQGQVQAPVIPPAADLTGGAGATTQDPLAQAGTAVTDALKARGSFAPYSPQPLNFVPPEQKKENPLGAALELFASALTARKNPQIAESIMGGRVAAKKEADAKQQRDYKTAQDQYQVQRDNEQAAERSSAAHEHQLDTAVALAEKNQQQLIQQQQKVAAGRVAEIRANAYAQSVINSHQDRVDTRSANAEHWAASAFQRDDEFTRRLGNQLELRRMSDANSLERAGLMSSTALTVSSQRSNLALAVEAMREQSNGQNLDKRLSVQTQLSAAEHMLTSYDSVIKAASNPLATPQQKAAAAALTTPDPKTQMTPYQKLMHDMQSVGISIPQHEDVTDMNSIRSTILADPENALSALSGGGGGAAGGGIVFAPQINVGGGERGGQPGAAAPPVPEHPAGGAGGPPAALPQTTITGSFGPTIQMYAQAHGVNPTLLDRVIHVGEASGVGAVSKAGAIGIAQFMPETAKQYGINPYDPYQSIDGAARYLHDLTAHYRGNIALAVAAYNAGPGAVDAVGGDFSKLPAETQAYVTRVMGGAPGQPGGGQPPPAAAPHGGGAAAPVAPAGGAPHQAGAPGANPVAPPPPGPPVAAQAAIKAYDTAYAGTGFDGAWGAISEKMKAHGATPQDLQQAEQALRQHVAQEQQKQQAQQKQQEAGQEAVRAGFQPGTPQYQNYVKQRMLRASAPPSKPQPPPPPYKPPTTAPTGGMPQPTLGFGGGAGQLPTPEAAGNRAATAAAFPNGALERPAGLAPQGGAMPHAGPVDARSVLDAVAKGVGAGVDVVKAVANVRPDLKRDPEVQKLAKAWVALYGRAPTEAEINTIRIGPAILSGGEGRHSHEERTRAVGSPASTPTPDHAQQLNDAKYAYERVLEKAMGMGISLDQVQDPSRPGGTGAEDGPVLKELRKRYWQWQQLQNPHVNYGLPQYK